MKYVKLNFFFLGGFPFPVNRYWIRSSQHTRRGSGAPPRDFLPTKTSLACKPNIPAFHLKGSNAVPELSDKNMAEPI